jgi:hypothetical protein
MECMTDIPAAVAVPTRPPARRPEVPEERAPLDIVDVVGEGSFPASDPPAAWTWEVGSPRSPSLP